MSNRPRASRRCRPVAPCTGTGRRCAAALLAVALLSLGGCAWETSRPAAPAAVPAGIPTGTAAGAATASVAQRAALTARDMVGTPYRWGGATPDGFDCSGLVHYAYAQHGVALPRTTARLYAAARPVALDALRAGDLVFFRTDAKGGHVGIALDEQRFVHAPSSGKRVAIARLSQPWYRDRLIRAGRVGDEPVAAGPAPGTAAP